MLRVFIATSVYGAVQLVLFIDRRNGNITVMFVLIIVLHTITPLCFLADELKGDEISHIVTVDAQFC